MIIVAILVWIVAILSLRIAIMGNPIAKMIKGLSEKSLARLDKLAHLGGHPSDPNDEKIIDHFSWLAILDMGLFIVETVLAFCFLLGAGYKWLMIVLIKNIIVLSVARRQASQAGKPITAISKLSPGRLAFDRLFSAISAITFMYLFLIITGVLK